MKKIFLVRVSLLLTAMVAIAPLTAEAKSSREVSARAYSTHLIYNEGVEYYLKGQYRRSLDAFKRVLDLDPLNINAKRYVKRIYQKQPSLEYVYNLNIDLPKPKAVPTKKETKRISTHRAKQMHRAQDIANYHQEKKSNALQARLNKLDTDIATLHSQLSSPSASIDMPNTIDTHNYTPNKIHRMHTNVAKVDEISNTRRRLDDKTRQLQEEKLKTRQLEKKYDKAKFRLDKLNMALANRDAEIDKLSHQLNKVTSEISFQEEDYTFEIEKLKHEVEQKQDIIRDQEEFITVLETELHAAENSLKDALNARNSKKFERIIIQRDQIIARLKTELAELKRYYSDVDDTPLEVTHVVSTSTQTTNLDLTATGGESSLQEKFNGLQQRLTHLQNLLEQKNAQIKALQSSLDTHSSF